MVGQLASQSSGGDEVGSEVAFEADAVVLNLGVEFGSVFSEEIAFEMVFGEFIVFVGVFDEVLGSLGVLLSEFIDADFESVGVGGRDA